MGGLEEQSRARLITSGSKLPVSEFYNTQAILLKDEAIRERPTFHLHLTFMSSAQFYHSECKVYLSADAILPCYSLNRAGLIIISLRAIMLPTYIYTCSTAQISQMFSFMHAKTLAELMYCIINDFIFTFTVGEPVATQGIHEHPTSNKAITFTSSLRQTSSKPCGARRRIYNSFQ